MYRDLHTRPLPSPRRTLLLLVILCGTIAGALTYSIHVQAEAERLFACLGTTDGVTDATVQMHGADGVLRNTPLTDDQLAALWELEGESIWAKDGRYGWDYPANIEDMTFARIWIFGKKEGVRFWFMAYVSDEYSFAFVFDNTVPFADANGEHLGTHPCIGAEVSAEDVLGALSNLAE